MTLEVRKVLPAPAETVSDKCPRSARQASLKEIKVIELTRTLEPQNDRRSVAFPFPELIMAKQPFACIGGSRLADCVVKFSVWYWRDPLQDLEAFTAVNSFKLTQKEYPTRHHVS